MIEWRHLALLSLCFFLFQNCGEFKSSFESGFYSYTSAPDFFHDIKLVNSQVDSEGREEFTFDFAVTYAHDLDQSVTYRVAFSTLNFSTVCRSVDGTADGGSKHFRLSCKIPVEDDLFVQLTLVGPQREELVEEYRF